ncbi:MAG: GatB/YqeY domain-containing protein [bacterium]|nr:GatB/YqeY domain-containing protein [bacterium]
MTLAERIDADLLTAMKAREALVVEVLRFLKSSLQNARIAARAGLNDADVEKLIASDVKRRTEAAAQFRTGGRQDLADADEAAIAILQAYLPKGLSEAEISAIITAQVSAVGATGPGDFGKVMGSVMAKVGTRADGKIIQALVKKILSP